MQLAGILCYPDVRKPWRQGYVVVHTGSTAEKHNFGIMVYMPTPLEKAGLDRM